MGQDENGDTGKTGAEQRIQVGQEQDERGTRNARKHMRAQGKCKYNLS